MNTNLQDSDYHFTRISNKWNEAVQSILDTAAFVSDARKELNDHQFQQLWERPDAPFSLPTAIKLEAIAQKKITTNNPRQTTTTLDNYLLHRHTR